MAVNDIELNVGVKLNEDEFLSAYESTLRKTSTATQNIVSSAVEDLTGPAAKGWQTLPYMSMHDAEAGNRATSKAFIASLAEDLNKAGITPQSQGYEAAMINAAYRSSIPDITERFRRLRAEGYYEQAALTAPGSALADAIESDYALMEQGWSRNFITSRTGANGQNEAFIDFEGMRDYAVNEGLGRWIDDDLKHTADNFELIDNTLEDIKEKSVATKKEFLDWGDSLKGVLGVLTAIGGVAVGALAKTVLYAEKGTIAAGGELDKRRAFIGMSALDELQTKVASRSIGLGEDSIKNEIYTMSDTIQQYKLLGQGDALPSSLLGIFDNLMNSDTPYETYKASADELYNKLKAMPVEERQRSLMLMNKMGLGTMSSLIGQFLSNENYAKQYGTPSALFNLETNPYYNTYQQAELLLPDITKLNESLKASYNRMYVAWEETFGLKFKDWWDDVMKDKVVPWFEKILGYLSGSSEENGSFANDVGDAVSRFNTNLAAAEAKMAVAGANIKDANPWVSAATSIVSEIPAGTIQLPQGLRAANAGILNWAAPVYSINEYDPSKFFYAVERASDTKSTVGSPSSYDKLGENEIEFAYRAGILTRWAERTGIAKDVSDYELGQLTEAGIQKLYAAMQVGRAYMLSGNYDATLSAFESQSMVNSDYFKIVATYLAEHQSEYRGDTERIREIKIRLLDPLGKDLPIEVMDALETAAGGVDFYTENNSLQR